MADTDTQPRRPTYFVRLGREVEGPYSPDQIQQRFDIQLFSSYHEVSPDGKDWQPLTEDGAWKTDGELLGDDPHDHLLHTADDEDDEDALGGFDALSEPSTKLSASPHDPDLAIASLLAVEVFTRSLMVSSGLLLAAVSGLAMLLGDGLFARWWKPDGPLGITLAVWCVVGFLLALAAVVPRSKQRGWGVGALAGVGFFAALGLLTDHPAMRMVTLIWLALGPVLGWAAAAQIIRVWRDPNRRERGEWVSQGIALSIAATGAWLSSVNVGLSNLEIPTAFVAVVAVCLLPVVFVAWQMLHNAVPGKRVSLALFTITAAGLVATAVALGVQQTPQPPATGQSVTPLLLTTVGLIALTGAFAAARLDHRRVHGSPHAFPRPAFN